MILSARAPLFCLIAMVGLIAAQNDNGEASFINTIGDSSTEAASTDIPSFLLNGAQQPQGSNTDQPGTLPSELAGSISGGPTTSDEGSSSSQSANHGSSFTGTTAQSSIGGAGPSTESFDPVSKEATIKPTLGDEGSSSTQSANHGSSFTGTTAQSSIGGAGPSTESFDPVSKEATIQPTLGDGGSSSTQSANQGFSVPGTNAQSNIGGAGPSTESFDPVSKEATIKPTSGDGGSSSQAASGETTIKPNVGGDGSSSTQSGYQESSGTGTASEITTIDSQQGASSPSSTETADQETSKPVIVPLPADYKEKKLNNSYGNRRLPGGLKFDDLPEQAAVFDGVNEFSKIIANNNTIYVLNAAQGKSENKTIDPYTIGELLGYIYETQEWGEEGPPYGFTIEISGKSRPTRALSEGSVQAHLVFKKREVVFEEKFWGKILDSFN